MSRAPATTATCCTGGSLHCSPCQKKAWGITLPTMPHTLSYSLHMAMVTRAIGLSLLAQRASAMTFPHRHVFVCRHSALPALPCVFCVLNIRTACEAMPPVMISCQTVPHMSFMLSSHRSCTSQVGPSVACVIISTSKGVRVAGVTAPHVIVPSVHKWRIEVRPF